MSARKPVTYANLGQVVGPRVAYIRSTDVEKMNWRRLLWSVPDEWFYLWARGRAVILKDATSNTRGGKIKRIFAPVLKDLLGTVYHGENPKYPHLVDHLHAAHGALKIDGGLGTKIRFWRGRIAPGGIRLDVESVQVTREPNTVYRLCPRRF